MPHHYLSVGCFQRELQYTTPTGMQKAIEFFVRENIDRLNFLKSYHYEDLEDYEFLVEDEEYHFINVLKEVMYILESNQEF